MAARRRSSWLRRPRTTQEKRASLDHPELVRAKRNYTNLPDAWDDIPIGRDSHKSWKSRRKGRKQYRGGVKKKKVFHASQYDCRWEHWIDARNFMEHLEKMGKCPVMTTNKKCVGTQEVETYRYRRNPDGFYLNEKEYYTYVYKIWEYTYTVTWRDHE